MKRKKEKRYLRLPQKALNSKRERNLNNKQNRKEK